MKVQRGDVVVVDFPYSDRKGSKIRPALVVQADANNVRLDDTILAMITGSKRRAVGAATQLFIDAKTPDGKAAGLTQNSVVLCETLVTLDQTLILRHLGHFSDALMQQIDDCLKASLDLP